MIDGSETSAAQPAPRPLLALAGGLTMPGLGHVYLGDPVRGALYLLAIALAVPGAARLGLASPPRLLLVVTSLGVAAAVGLYVWSAVDAFRRARRAIVAASPWRRSGVYILYAAVGYASVLIPSTTYVRDNLLETFVVPAGSMMPTVLPVIAFWRTSAWGAVASKCGGGRSRSSSIRTIARRCSSSGSSACRVIASRSRA